MNRNRKPHVQSVHMVGYPVIKTVRRRLPGWYVLFVVALGLAVFLCNYF